MSKRSVRKMILDLDDLDITKEELRQTMEIKTLIDDAMQFRHPKVGFEHVVWWWCSAEPADA